MKPTYLFVCCGIIFGIFSATMLRADQLEMQNGDRYVGKILSVTAETVLLQSDVLGKVSLPRKKVASLAFGTNAVSPQVTGRAATIPALTNLPNVASLKLTQVDNSLSATPQNLAANPDLVQQVREQLLSGSPEAGAKFDELVSGFTSGRVNISDLRREAKSSADQLRKLKTELGPEVGDSLDAYLEVLDGFLHKTAAGQTNSSSYRRPQTP